MLQSSHEIQSNVAGLPQDGKNVQELYLTFIVHMQ